MTYWSSMLHLSSTWSGKIGIQWVIHQLYIDFKKTYDLAKIKASCNIIIEFCIPTQISTLIKMCCKVNFTVKARNNISIGTTVKNSIEWYLYHAHCGTILGPWTWWGTRKWNCRWAHTGWFCSEVYRIWAVPEGLKAEYQK